MNSWYLSLPSAAAHVPCGGGRHTVRWQSGALLLPDHPDVEAEMVLTALGGDKPGCVELAEIWRRRASDVSLLMQLPRSGADEVRVRWEDVAAYRAARSGLTALPGGPLPAAAASSRNAAWHIGRPRADAADARRRYLETLTVLALGLEFQMRLAGTIAASGTGLPALTVALAGRFAPVAARWLGVHPDDVAVSVHTGPGWGTLRAADHLVRASLPVDWLSSVWACGLELVDGNLVVAVTSPGWPDARVLALNEPGQQPVELAVHRGPRSEP